ncbi:22805_t:CDS:2, partial [Gigaspora margarita]
WKSDNQVRISGIIDEHSHPMSENIQMTAPQYHLEKGKLSDAGATYQELMRRKQDAKFEGNDNHLVGLLWLHPKQIGLLFYCNKLVALDNKDIWTANSDSSIKRWLDVPPRHILKAISQNSSSSMSPTSPQLSPILTIPLSSMINLTSTGVSYGVTLDAE